MSEATTPSDPAAIYRSPAFVRRASDALGRDAEQVALAVDGLLQARRIPFGGGIAPDVAVWADAARIVAALAAAQVAPASVVTIAERICAMPLRSVAPHPAVDPPRTFGADLASLLRHRRSVVAAEGGFPAVSVAWSRGAQVLGGRIDFAEFGGPKRRYRQASPPVADLSSHAPPTAMKLRFASSSLVRFGDVMAGCVLGAEAVATACGD